MAKSSLALAELIFTTALPFLFVYAAYRLARNRRNLWVGVVLLAGAVLVGNFSIWPYFFGAELFGSYYYESSDYGFRGWEYPKTGDSSYQQLRLNFADYRRSIGRRDIVLRRTFRRDPWRFWRWYEYLSEKRWHYPYAAPAFCPYPMPQSCRGWPPGPIPYQREIPRTPAEQNEQASALERWM
jgi:hypothetical protein